MSGTSNNTTCRTSDNTTCKDLKIRRRPGDVDHLAKEVRRQLKKIAFTDKPTVFEMYLHYNSDRKGFLSKNNVRDMCRKMNLPADDDILSAVVEGCTKDTQGRINLEEFRRFVEGRT